jgi:hypothetical protein
VTTAFYTALEGCIDRGGTPPSTYRTSMGGYVVQADWGTLQPNISYYNAGTIAGHASGFTGSNPIDQAILDVRAWNSNSGAYAGQNPNLVQWGLVLRVGAGINAPTWLYQGSGNLGFGSFTATDTAGQRPVTGTCPAFWQAGFQTAFNAFEAALVAAYDGAPEIVLAVICSQNTVYDEPFIRQTNNATQMAAMWNLGFKSAASGDKGVTPGTDQYNLLTDIAHRSVWQKTRISADANPLQLILSATQAGSDAAFPGVAWAYMLNGKTVTGQPAFGGFLGSLTDPTDAQCEAENNSARPSYLSQPPTQSYGQMYAAMNALGTLNHIQTAAMGQMPNTNPGSSGAVYQTVAGCAAIGCSSVELPGGFNQVQSGQTQPPLSPADVAALTALLAANVPAPAAKGILPVGSEFGYKSTAAVSSATLQGVPTLTVGNDLIIDLIGRAAVAPTSLVPSDGSNTYQLIDSVVGGTGVFHARYRARITTGGSITIQVTCSEPCGLTVSGQQFSGMIDPGTSLYDQTAHASGTGSEPSVVTAGNTSAANELVWAGIGTRNNQPVTISAQTFTPSTTPTINQQWTATGSNVSLDAQTAWEVSGATHGTQEYAVNLSPDAGPWTAIISTFEAATSSVTPQVTSAPAGVSATAVGDGTATVGWSAPFSGTTQVPAISSFTAELLVNGVVSVTVTGISAAATSHNFTGLTDGTTYVPNIIAINSVGPSAPGVGAGFTPAAVASKPGQAVITGVIPGAASAEVDFTQPSPTGTPPLTSTTITPYVGGVAGTPSTFTDLSTAEIINNLVNGTPVQFSMHWTNAQGDGPESALSAAVTPQAGPAPPNPGTPVTGAGSPARGVVIDPEGSARAVVLVTT